MVSEEIRTEVEKQLARLENYWKDYSDYRRFMTREKTARLAREAITNYYATNSHQLYNHNSETSGDVQLPIFVLDEWLQERPVQEVVGDLKLFAQSHIDKYGLAKTVESSVYKHNKNPSDIKKENVEQYLQNPPVYRVSGLNSEPPFFDFELTKFMTVLSQVNRLYYELFDAINVSDDVDIGTNFFNDRLEYRNQEVPDFNHMLNLKKKQRFLNMNIFTVFNRDGEYVTPISERGPGDYQYPTWYSIVPTGNFHYLTAPQDEFDLQHSILRAVKQNIFSNNHLTNNLRETPPLRLIKKGLETGDVTLRYTGAGVDAITTNVHMTGVLLIDNPEYLENYDTDFTKGFKRVSFIPIENELFPEIIENPKTTPASALALSLGRDYLDENNYVNL